MCYLYMLEIKNAESITLNVLGKKNRGLLQFANTGLAKVLQETGAFGGHMLVL